MSERIRESLSALMDGEANELELERVLSQSEQPEMRSAWSRYQLVRVVMRGNTEPRMGELDVSHAVREALEDDGSTAIGGGRWSNLMRPMASFAVAASVFAAVLVGSQLYGLMGSGPDAVNGAGLADRVSPVGMVNTMGGSALNASYGSPAVKSQAPNRRAAYNQLARQRLQKYMVPHADKASLNGPQGMMPYARVSSFQEQE